MKKTLKSLLIAGALFFVAPLVGNAQASTANYAGAFGPGTVVTVTLSAGDATYLNTRPGSAGIFAAGQVYTFVVVQEPDPENFPSPDFENLELTADGLVGPQLALLTPGVNNDYTLQYLAPVDLGLSALLGAGAIAAVKRARNKRKHNAVA
jgi:hypothetical protein